LIGLGINEFWTILVLPISSRIADTPPLIDFHQAGLFSKTTSTFRLGYTIPGFFLYLFAGGYIVEDT